MGQFAKFVLLGAVSTLADYSLFMLLLALNVDYVPSIVLGYSLGLAVNFAAGRKYIFTGGRKLERTHSEFVAVAVIALFGLLINIAVVKLLSFGVWRADPLHARVVAIGAAFFWNYAARKLFVYH